MADLSKVLGGPWSPPLEKQVAPPEAQLIDAMRAAGLEPPEQIHFDGFGRNVHKIDNVGHCHFSGLLLCLSVSLSLSHSPFSSF